MQILQDTQSYSSVKTQPRWKWEIKFCTDEIQASHITNKNSATEPATTSGHNSSLSFQSSCRKDNSHTGFHKVQQ